MAIGLIIAVVLLAMLLFALAGAILLGRILSQDSEGDDALSDKPVSRRKRSYSERFLRRFSSRRGAGPRRLTHRRDHDRHFRNDNR